MAFIVESESLPLLPCKVGENIHESGMRADGKAVLQIPFLLGNKEFFCPFLVFFAVSAVVFAVLNGIRKHPIDTVKAVLLDDSLGTFAI